MCPCQGSTVLLKVNLDLNPIYNSWGRYNIPVSPGCLGLAFPHCLRIMNPFPVRAESLKCRSPELRQIALSISPLTANPTWFLLATWDTGPKNRLHPILQVPILTQQSVCGPYWVVFLYDQRDWHEVLRWPKTGSCWSNPPVLNRLGRVRVLWSTGGPMGERPGGFSHPESAAATFC